MKRGLLSGVVFIASCGIAIAQNADCDARLADAFRAHLKMDGNSDISQAARDMVCRSLDGLTNGKIDVVTSDMLPSGTGIDRISSSRECLSKSNDYFYSKRLEIGLSYLPKSAAPAVIDACLGQGAKLTVMAPSNDGTNIALRLDYRGQGAGSTKITALSITPPDALAPLKDQTGAIALNNGATLDAAGIVQEYKRDTTKDITVAVTFKDAPPQTITIPRTQPVSLEWLNWDETIAGLPEKATSAFSCAANGRNFPNAGAKFNCLRSNACGPESRPIADGAGLIGFCIREFGAGLLKVGSDVTKIESKNWSIALPDRDNLNLYVCLKDGKLIDGSLSDCEADGSCTKGVDGDSSSQKRINSCIGRFGIRAAAAGEPRSLSKEASRIKFIGFNELSKSPPSQ